MKLKIMLISDIHGKSWAASQLSIIASREKYDIIIVSGDLSPYMSIETAKEMLEILVESGAPIYYVPGNMDDPKLSRGVSVDATHCIHRKCIKLTENLYIAGVGGGLVGPFKTPFEYTEDDFNRILGELSMKIPSSNFILVTHNPPYNTATDKLSWGEHVGSMSIRRFIEVKQPILHVCGHIHESRGIDRIGRTVIVNPGPAMRGYYAEAQIENSEVKVELLQLK